MTVLFGDHWVIIINVVFVAMGRLNKTGAGSSVSVHYRKLAEDYTGGACEALKLMPTLPEYMSYCCHHCGHKQKLKVMDVAKKCANIPLVSKSLSLRNRWSSLHDSQYVVEGMYIQEGDRIHHRVDVVYFSWYIPRENPNTKLFYGWEQHPHQLLTPLTLWRMRLLGIKLLFLYNSKLS